MKMNKGEEDSSHDSHSVCSSAPSGKPAHSKRPKKMKKSESRRRTTFNGFTLPNLFCNLPFARRFRNTSSTVVTVNKRKQNITCDASSSESSSNFAVSKGSRNSHGENGSQSNQQSCSSVQNYQTRLQNETVDCKKIVECPLCLLEQPYASFPHISTCEHRSCMDCLQQYLSIEISESRINISCPVCTEPLHPSDLQALLENCSRSNMLMKYQDFMVRRVLLNTEPDARWCPAPDCNYAVIASGCASCPKLQCESPGCETSFCYHCKQEWHPNQTCDAARAERSPNMYMFHGSIVRSSSVSFSQGSNLPQRDDIKPCPRCQVLIVKMDDGSCNHISCLICGSEFCWLCMKEISDLHYLSPSGCTFWGKKPWSRKKKILWQLGTLVGAPVGIGLVAAIAIPAMIIGIPIWVGIKVHSNYNKTSKRKRHLAIGGGVAASIIVSPVIAGIAVSIGVPVLLAYTYGVVPVSLCRGGGCGVSTSPSGGVKIVDFNDEDQNDQISGLSVGGALSDGHNLDSVSVSQQSGSHPANYQSISAGNPSIGEVSLQGCSVSASISFGGDSQLERMATLSVKEQEYSLQEPDKESSSTRALAGSIASSIIIGGSGSANTPSRSDLQQSDVSSNKRFSLSSTSPSEKSNTMSMANDDTCSTKALAGSIVGYRETIAYNAPVEVHVDAPPLDLTIKPDSPAVSLTTSKPSTHCVSKCTDLSSTCHTSLIDTSTQTTNLTDISVNPVITPASVVYPKISTAKAHNLTPSDSGNQLSIEVGVQVETMETNNANFQPICDKNEFLESAI